MLRSLKEDGHRCLIFSQMSKMLNILEKFLSYHGYTYLRLDGKLKPEDRMSVMERFNYDKRIFILLLSTRAGGLGVNLIGADTVIFYDSDWNPQIDAQAQDRCHRIGQTKEVNVYRMISESTVEERILETANKKRVLADLAIEQGQFSGGSLFSRNAMVKDLLGEDLEVGGDETLRDRGDSGSCSRAESPSDQLKLLEKVEDEDDALEKRDLDAEIRKIKEVDDADMNLEQLREGEREIKEKYEMIIESLNPLSKRCLRLIEDETVNSAQTIIM